MVASSLGLPALTGLTALMAPTAFSALMALMMVPVMRWVIIAEVARHGQPPSSTVSNGLGKLFIESYHLG